jgi:PKD repeat protein
MKIVLRVFLVLSLALIVASCGNDEQSSTITGMSPNQFSIGQQNAVASITGKNLSATAVSLGDGITVTNFSLKSSSEIEVHFNVSSGAAAGPRVITVNTTTGAISANNGLNITSNKVPKAQFSISPSAGSLITVFEFNAEGSSDPNGQDHLSYAWKLSDGTNATGKKLNHKFKEIGSHNIELTVTDNQGGSAVAARNLEVLKNSPPIIKFKVSPGAKGDTNTQFEFDASATTDPDGRVKDWIWDFGDNTRKVHGEVVDHQYEKAGKYNVELTAVDNKGQEASDQAQLEVEKSTEIVCAGSGSSHPLIIKGTVVAVEPGQWAVTDFGPGHNCSNTWHRCDDYRIWGGQGVGEFFGIIDKMTDRGNGVLAVHNSCPYRWPPYVGQRTFVYYKTCAKNHC